MGERRAVEDETRRAREGKLGRRGIRKVDRRWEDGAMRRTCRCGAAAATQGGDGARAAATTMVSLWPGQEVAAVAAVAAELRRASVAAASGVGLLPRPSARSHIGREETPLFS